MPCSSSSSPGAIYHPDPAMTSPKQTLPFQTGCSWHRPLYLSPIILYLPSICCSLQCPQCLLGDDSWHGGRIMRDALALVVIFVARAPLQFEIYHIWNWIL
jgi:hypothetical protein